MPIGHRKRLMRAALAGWRGVPTDRAKEPVAAASEPTPAAAEPMRRHLTVLFSDVRDGFDRVVGGDGPRGLPAAAGTGAKRGEAAVLSHGGSIWQVGATAFSLISVTRSRTRTTRRVPRARAWSWRRVSLALHCRRASGFQSV